LIFSLINEEISRISENFALAMNSYWHIIKGFDLEFNNKKDFRFPQTFAYPEKKTKKLEEDLNKTVRRKKKPKNSDLKQKNISRNLIIDNQEIVISLKILIKLITIFYYIGAFNRYEIRSL